MGWAGVREELGERSVRDTEPGGGGVWGFQEVETTWSQAPELRPPPGLVWRASETNRNLNLNCRVGFGAGSQTTLYTLSYAAYSLESTF